MAQPTMVGSRESGDLLVPEKFGLGGIRSRVTPGKNCYRVQKCIARATVWVRTADGSAISRKWKQAVYAIFEVGKPTIMWSRSGGTVGGSSAAMRLTEREHGGG